MTITINYGTQSKSDMVYYCPRCKSEFANYKDLKEHRTKEASYLICP